jgi:DNA-directed RNA polymerase specialized sigma24 family protein
VTYDGVERASAPVEFEQWYRGERPRLLLSVLVLTGDRDLAAEATDEAFVRALQRWSRVREMDSPEGWTYRVAVNVVRRLIRRRLFERRVFRRSVPVEVVPAPAGEVWELVRTLSDRQREAVALRYIADLTEPEIALVMGVTRGTVASTLADARGALRDALADAANAEEER